MRYQTKQHFLLGVAIANIPRSIHLEPALVTLISRALLEKVIFIDCTLSCNLHVTSSCDCVPLAVIDVEIKFKPVTLLLTSVE
jgi:hypothetical protein